MSRRTGALEHLDDDHAPAAARAGIRGYRRSLAAIRIGGVARVRSWVGSVEQLPSPSDVLGSTAIGKQAVVADAVEPAGQHVDEEAADELVDYERHQLAVWLLLVAVILPFEGDPGIVECDKAAVGNGDTVSVARKIGQDCLWSAEWVVYAKRPFGPAQRREMIVECFGIRQCDQIAEELQLSGEVRGR